MLRARTIAIAILTAGVTACAGMGREEDIDISAVPSAAIDAAKGAVPGLEIRSAEAERKNGRTVYELEGMSDGVEHEVKVTAAGEVLKVKTDD